MARSSVLRARLASAAGFLLGAALVALMLLLVAARPPAGQRSGSAGAETEVLGVVVDRPAGEVTPVVPSTTTPAVVTSVSLPTATPPPLSAVPPFPPILPPPADPGGQQSAAPASNAAPAAPTSNAVPAAPEETTTTQATPAAEASPVSDPAASSGGPAEIGAAARALIQYDFETRLPLWEISFLPGRSTVRGLTFPDSLRIEIYVRAEDTPADVARVMAHEFGHAVDLSLNNATDRAAWRSARGGAPEVPWWPSGSTYDFDTMAGDFAEGFASWQVGSSNRSNVAGAFTSEQLALMASLAEG